MAGETDVKETKPTPIAPVQVTVVGVGAADPKFLPTGTVAHTAEDSQPNVIVNVVNPALAIAFRFTQTFLTAFVGLLAAAMTPAGSHLLYTSDFVHMLGTNASLSLPIAALGLLKDLLTIFTDLANKYPLLKA